MIVGKGVKVGTFVGDGNVDGLGVTGISGPFVGVGFFVTVGFGVTTVGLGAVSYGFGVTVTGTGVVADVLANVLVIRTAPPDRVVNRILSPFSEAVVLESNL